MLEKNVLDTPEASRSESRNFGLTSYKNVVKFRPLQTITLRTSRHFSSKRSEIDVGWSTGKKILESTQHGTVLKDFTVCNMAQSKPEVLQIFL